MLHSESPGAHAPGHRAKRHCCVVVQWVWQEVKGSRSAGRDGRCFSRPAVWVRTLTSCVVLGKLPNFSEPQFASMSSRGHCRAPSGVATVRGKRTGAHTVSALLCLLMPSQRYYRTLKTRALWHGGAWPPFHPVEHLGGRLGWTALHLRGALWGGGGPGTLVGNKRVRILPWGQGHLPARGLLASFLALRLALPSGMACWADFRAGCRRSQWVRPPSCWLSCTGGW